MSDDTSAAAVAAVAPEAITAPSTATPQPTTSSPTTYTRSYSPSPSTSPTPALLACPSLDRSFSTNSSAASEYSRLSTGSRSSTGSAAAAARRRGYVRPQGAAFAESAKNRDSVMSLGSIAHLQYYFARTGVLDGKGAQLAREDPFKAKKHRSGVLDVAIADPMSPIKAGGGELAASPVGYGGEADEEGDDWDDPFMLPPTVSTYNHRNQYVPPPPDVGVLRDELRAALGHLDKALDDLARSDEEQQRELPAQPPVGDGDGDGEAEGQRSPNRGWHEIQGTHILDVATLAIKAARDYYLMHDRRELLARVKPERQIREELLGVMDVLKRMAVRSFAGGVRADEAAGLRAWPRAVEAFLAKERAVEQQERGDRDSWPWLGGDWAGRERERERQFMLTFLGDDGAALPPWADPEAADAAAPPTEMQRALGDGLLLCRLHNSVLARSRRQYARIDAPHTDFAVPYRAAENLRWWLKAAEIRWEIRLGDQLDVLDVVYDKNPAAWLALDAAALRWCHTVREEITREWRSGAVTVDVPELRYD